MNIRSWLVLAGLALQLQTPTLALSPPEIHARAVRSVAALELLDEAGQSTSAVSAVHLGGRRFVSVCENVDQAARLQLRLGQRQALARVAVRDRERNLCLLDADEALGEPMALRAGLPGAGERVFAVSNALGLGVGISDGVVAGTRNGPQGRMLQFTAPISPGSEGGALVDADGRLVAVLDYRRRDGQNVNFGAPVAWLDEIAARAEAVAEQRARFDTGSALARQAQWPALAEHATRWLAAQPDQPDALRFAAQAAHMQQRPDDELAARSTLHRLQPGDLQAGLDLAELLLQQGRQAQALQLGRQLVAEHAGEARAHWLLARALHEDGALDAAEAAYRQALALDPWLVPAYRGLAWLARSRGDWATAAAGFSRLSGLYPQEAWPRLQLVQTLVQAGQYARAHAELQQLPAAHADSAEAWVLRGMLLGRSGRFEGAVQALRHALARAPQAEAAVHAELGRVLAAMQRYPEAIAAFQDAVRSEPAATHWQLLLAEQLGHGGRAEEGLQVIHTLAAAEVEDASRGAVQGFLLARLDRHAEAVPALERALQRDPRQTRAWVLLVRSHQQLGQRQQARQAHQRLRELDAATADSLERMWIRPFEEATR